MTLNEHTDLSTLAVNLKKKVNGLLCVYFLIILLTILLYVAIVGAAGLAGWSMLKGGRIHGRALALLLAVIVAATGALVAVLKPVFMIFKPAKKKGTEIHREDHPELFSLIDDVVKDVDCREPKHVYVDSECNASVCYPSIFGYIKNDGRQNLNIGLPLMYALNRTEMKAILAHEFGHFTQKSVQMNQVANLSEFICGSILNSQDFFEEVDNDSYLRYARGYMRFVGKVMRKQYDKVAPLNGILSRAQEFDADHYSQRVTGTEASVSALSKLSHIAIRWENYTEVLAGIEQNDERAPESVLDSLWAFSRVHESLGAPLLTPEARFSEPLLEFPSRLTSVADTNTHPSTKERVETLKSYPEVRTLWDNRPALGMFDKALTQKTFNSVRDEIQKAVFPEKTVFLKNDITPEDITLRFEDANPPRFSRFYLDPVFFTEECVPEEAGAPDPFTPENAVLAMEYHTAREDMDTLLAIREGNDKDVKFRYLGKEYDGTCAPVDLHKAYFDPLHARMIEVAKRCNARMETVVATTGKSDEWKLFRNCAEVLFKLENMHESLNQADYIAANELKGLEMSESVSKTKNDFRSALEPFMTAGPDGKRDIDRLRDYAELSKGDYQYIIDYYQSDPLDINLLVRAAYPFQNATFDARKALWEELVCDLMTVRDS